MSKLNLLTLLSSCPAGTAPLTQVRLGRNETAVIPITLDCETLNVHYCDDPAISAFVQCDGPGNCLLCQSGMSVDQRVLTPVYDPIAALVAVLMMSNQSRPKSLLPQFVQHVDTTHKNNQRIVMFIKRCADFNSFEVSSRLMQPDEDDGATAIMAYETACKAGTVDLKSIIQNLTPAQLWAVPSIAAKLKLKGVQRP